MLSKRKRDVNQRVKYKNIKVRVCVNIIQSDYDMSYSQSFSVLSFIEFLVEHA